MLDLIKVLATAWHTPFKTRSNFAREYADAIAMAASEGLVTTKVATGLYQRSWMITPQGLSHLFALRGESTT